MSNIHFLIDFLLFGFFPEQQRWRLMIILLICLSHTWLTLKFARHSIPLKTFILCSFCLLTSSWYLAFGDGWLLNIIPTNQLSGFILNICLAYWSIPIATVMSVGFCYLMIYQPELWPTHCFVILAKIIRSIPLITLLFFITLILPMMTNIEITRFQAALTGLIIFLIAYIVEVFKGAHQAIDTHQHESAAALQITGIRKFIHIDLPQIIKNSIPSLINTYIGLIKDTALVTIIGLSDSLGNLQLLIAKYEFKHDFLLLFAIIAALFWMLCFICSLFGKKLEKAIVYE
ncbi:MAG: ABC transporter permease subunit [Gammaproteobacteria bacterium]|nr:ABC transporter permease subunit [Gammaproteobacteria bacterium]